MPGGVEVPWRPPNNTTPGGGSLGVSSNIVELTKAIFIDFNTHRLKETQYERILSMAFCQTVLVSCISKSSYHYIVWSKVLGYVS